MKQEMVRFNLQIPINLKQSLNTIAKSTGIRTTTLVKDVLQKLVAEYKQKQLEENLINGYRYLAQEYKDICQDFKYIDSEGWDE